jgi:hypothetical protein
MLSEYVDGRSGVEARDVAPGQYAAGRARGGHYVGMAEGARVVLDANQQEKEAALALRIPLERVLTATACAALLPSGEVRQASLELGQAASACGEAYGQDNLWQRGRASQARHDADTARRRGSVRGSSH